MKVFLPFISTIAIFQIISQEFLTFYTIHKYNVILVEWNKHFKAYLDILLKSSSNILGIYNLPIKSKNT